MSISYHDRLLRDGYFVLEGLLSPETCAGLLEDVMAAFAQGTWSYTHAGRFRAHCPLRMSSRIIRTIKSSMRHGYEAVDMVLHRRKLLVELSSITVFPNARQQTMHPDERDPERQIVTVFVNLFPTARAVGALCVVPGSHRPDAPPDGIPQELVLPAGSAVFMNSKLRHAGTENSSADRIRPVVYFSFGDDDIAGPTYSIRPEYQRRYQLSDFRVRVPVAACRPRFSPDRWAAVDLRSGAAARRIILMDGTQLDETLNLSDQQRWILDTLELIGQLPEKLTATELADRVGVDVAAVVDVLRELNDAGLVDWASPSAAHVSAARSVLA